MNEKEISDLTFLKIMIKKYWTILLLLIIGIIIAIIGAMFTLYYVIYNLEIGNGGTATLGEFSLGDLILWCLWVILWEVLVILIPLIIYICIIGGLWWRKLPQEDKDEIKSRKKREEKQIEKYGGGAGALGFFIFIVFLIIVHLDDNLFEPFNNIPYIYWIGAYLMAALWIFVIIGIPITILGLCYLRKKLKDI